MLKLLLLALFLLLLLYSSNRKQAIHQNGKKLRRPPDTLPIFGNTIKFLQSRHVLFRWFVNCQNNFGVDTYEISVASLPPGVVISSPENLEYVFKNEAIITKGDFFRKRSWDLFGHGIINADGEIWRAQRKAGLKFFSGNNLETMVEVVLPKVFDQTRQRLHGHVRAGTELDLQAIFLDLTTAVVGRMAYNMDIKGSSPFSRAFDYASDHIGRRFQNPLYRLTERLTGSTLRSSFTEVKRFGKEIVKNAQERLSLRVAEDKVQDNLIDSLLTNLQDPTLVADSALNFLSAGRDTTAQSLTWTFYLLLRHPTAGAQVRQEISNNFPSLVPPNDVSEQPTRAMPLFIADLQPTILPITLATYHESLRLYPPVPFEIKQCQAPTILPDGTFLPPGSIIVWCIWAMNRSPQIWDSTQHSPETFCPRRHLDPGTGKFLSQPTSQYPVFNGGARSCLGKKMAEVMALYVIVRLISEFDFEEVVEFEESNGKTGARRKKERISQNSLTLPMEGGLPCLVRLRKI